MARTRKPKDLNTSLPSTNGAAVGDTNATRSESRRLEVVKNDFRPSVLPINLEEEIRRRAYELSERRGFLTGHETEDWLSAEQEVLQRYRQHSA